MDSIVTFSKGETLELNRKIMNDSMDVIYQVGHKKIEVDEGKIQIKTLLQAYFFQGSEELAEENLARFEHHFESLLLMTYTLLEKIDTNHEPLYKSIVKMNQLLVATKKLKQTFLQNIKQPSKKDVVVKRASITQELLTFKSQTQKKEQDKMQKEQDRVQEDTVQKSHESIHELVNDVLEHKKKLQLSVERLNKSLEQVGFEFRELDSIKN